MGLGRAKNRAKDVHMKFLRMWAVPGLRAGIPCRAAGGGTWQLCYAFA